MGTAGRPLVSHATMPMGTRIAVPIAWSRTAVQRVSADVLSRTFQPACSTAAVSTRTMARVGMGQRSLFGATGACAPLGRRSRASATDVAPPHAERAERDPADGEERACGHARPVELAEDRLPEMPLERHVEELVGEAHDRPDELPQEEGDRDDERHRGGEARPDEAANREADPGDGGGIQAEDGDADRERSEIARRRLRRGPDDDAGDHDPDHDRDPGHYRKAALDRPADPGDRW